ncbi:MAG: hypothetical protein E7012_01650 [Alphaproteobacteria bacterium]|nr:hypothetical protein [Alphaproteobacteria bacterium]
MKKSTIKLSLSAMIFLLGGCAYSSDAIFPDLFGEEEEKTSTVAEDTPVTIVGSTNFEPINISEGNNTGTFVGQKVVMFRNELTQLQSSIRNNNAQLQEVRSSVVNNALQYHKAIGMIEAKLQVGTTPGNPQMFGMLEGAQNNIQVMNANANTLSQLAAKVAADSANTDYLVNAIRSAYSISGAVDEDHRQLHILENEASQTSILMNSLLNEVNSDISRQKQYINTASDTIVYLSSAIKVGSYGVNNVPFTGSISNTGFGSSPSVSSGSPLFVVKFNKSDVKYQNSLKQAVSNALSKKPSVIFDVVAVSPTNGSSAIAKNNATQIFQDMIDMGVNAANINLSAKSGTGTSSEVQIFVR